MRNKNAPVERLNLILRFFNYSSLYFLELPKLIKQFLDGGNVVAYLTGKPTHNVEKMRLKHAGLSHPSHEQTGHEAHLLCQTLCVSQCVCVCVCVFGALDVCRAFTQRGCGCSRVHPGKRFFAPHPHCEDAHSAADTCTRPGIKSSGRARARACSLKALLIHLSPGRIRALGTFLGPAVFPSFSSASQQHNLRERKSCSFSHTPEMKSRCNIWLCSPLPGVKIVLIAQAGWLH